MKSLFTNIHSEKLTEFKGGTVIVSHTGQGDRQVVANQKVIYSK